MNKVKVSREVAEAIERLRKNGHDNNSFIEGHVKYGYELDENKCLNELDTETLARALLIGYEVEETPEEEILEVYNFKYGAGWGAGYTAGVRYGIKKTLDVYGIKIKGVNDDETESKQ